MIAHPTLGGPQVVAALLDHERTRLRPGLVILADRRDASSRGSSPVVNTAASAVVGNPTGAR